jgi:hypothetical protein
MSPIITRYEVRWTTYVGYGTPRHHVRRFDTDTAAWEFRNAEVNKHPEEQDDPVMMRRVVRVTEQEVG